MVFRRAVAHEPLNETAHRERPTAGPGWSRRPRRSARRGADRAAARPGRRAAGPETTAPVQRLGAKLDADQLGAGLKYELSCSWRAELRTELAAFAVPCFPVPRSASCAAARPAGQIRTPVGVSDGRSSGRDGQAEEALELVSQALGVDIEAALAQHQKGALLGLLAGPARSARSARSARCWLRVMALRPLCVGISSVLEEPQLALVICSSRSPGPGRTASGCG